ncbi:hypothetical protein CBFG_05271 [Clostridiales bacterium 1_7_47FAA]|nr:hypothetical protein CBFG_05271 [Clostridiales bacterium 1_7_47FAA]
MVRKKEWTLIKKSACNECRRKSMRQYSNAGHMESYIIHMKLQYTRMSVSLFRL